MPCRFLHISFVLCDEGYPVGYAALFSDPDGHPLELPFGQEVTSTVAYSP